MVLHVLPNQHTIFWTIWGGTYSSKNYENENTKQKHQYKINLCN